MKSSILHLDLKPNIIRSCIEYSGYHSNSGILNATKHFVADAPGWFNDQHDKEVVSLISSFSEGEKITVVLNSLNYEQEEIMISSFERNQGIKLMFQLIRNTLPIYEVTATAQENGIFTDEKIQTYPRDKNKLKLLCTKNKDYFDVFADDIKGLESYSGVTFSTFKELLNIKLKLGIKSQHFFKLKLNICSDETLAKELGKDLTVKIMSYCSGGNSKQIIAITKAFDHYDKKYNFITKEPNQAEYEVPSLLAEKMLFNEKENTYIYNNTDQAINFTKVFEYELKFIGQSLQVQDLD